MSKLIEVEPIKNAIQKMQKKIGCSGYDVGYSRAIDDVLGLLADAPAAGTYEPVYNLESATIQVMNAPILYATEDVAGYKKGEAVQVYGTKTQEGVDFFLIWSKVDNSWRWRWQIYFTPVP